MVDITPPCVGSLAVMATQDGLRVTSVHRGNVIALAVALTITAALSIRYAGMVGPSRFDLTVGDLIMRLPDRFTNELLLVVHGLGPSTVSLVAIAAGVLHLVRRDATTAVLCAASPLTTGVATTALQEVVGRSLEPGGGPALPSGHTGGATAMALVVGLTMVRTRPHSVRITALAGSVVCTTSILMALALIRNGLHVASDTVAGAGTAIVVLASIRLAADLCGLRTTRPPNRHGARRRRHGAQ